MTTANPSSGPLAAIGEYFTFRRALEVHERLPAPARKSIATSLALGRQRADAAEALWSNGHAAEALRLAIEALGASSDAAREFALGLGTPVTAPVPASIATPSAPGAPSEHAGETGGDAKAATDDDAETGTESADEAAKAESADEDAKTATDDEDAKTASADDDAKTAMTEEPFPAADPAATRATALRARGISPARISSVEAAIVAARGASLPALDADVSPTHAELFRQVMDAHRVVDRALTTAALERREIRFARASRIGTAVFFTALVLFGVYFATRRPEGVFVETSAVWANAPAFGGETVIDGRPDTYWLVPDGQSGWVEVRMSPSRRIEHVTVLNAHNPPHGDRATRDYRIEIYAGGALARSIDGSFEYSTSPEPVTHDVGIDDVERIRFVVRSHHRTGAGLAELSWD